MDLIYFDAGGGHRSAATALRLVAEQQQRPWNVRLVNLQEVLDELDIFRKVTGIRLQDIYNLLLKKGWTLGSAQLLRAMQFILRLYHPAGVRLLEPYWRKTQPDMVVSLVPNLNRALGESLRKALPRVPFVTVLTDLADYPPHFWMEKQQQYFVCGSDRAVQQALELGHPRERVFQTSGMILHPRFYEPISVERRAERERLGLLPERTTALVLFGGQGSKVMQDIAEHLDRSGLELQLILVCGRNEKLANILRERHWKIPTLVEGFTLDIPRYMHLADFFIGKPGPGSISEALAMKLPVIVERNAWTLPQERFNVEWVRQQGLGLVVRNFQEVSQAVEQLLEPAFYAQCRANACALENRAVFEIPSILENIMARGA